MGLISSGWFLLLEKDEEIYQLKEKLEDMVQESQDKLNQRDQALALKSNSD